MRLLDWFEGGLLIITTLYLLREWFEKRSHIALVLHGMDYGECVPYNYPEYLHDVIEQAIQRTFASDVRYEMHQGKARVCREPRYIVAKADKVFFDGVPKRGDSSTNALYASVESARDAAFRQSAMSWDSARYAVYRIGGKCEPVTTCWIFDHDNPLSLL